MAYRKLEIHDGQLMLDDASAGLLATSPPDGVAASTSVTAEENSLVLSIEWTIEKLPDQLLPLEILNLRLGEFFPHASFIGGRSYEISGARAAQGRKLGFPYDTYYKFRIEARHHYDAALFSKMPLACWQEKETAFAVMFPKELILSQGPVPLFIKASGVGAGVRFSAAILSEFDVERKTQGWFGGGAVKTRREVLFKQGQSFRADFVLTAADTWADCVRLCEKRLYRTSRVTTPIAAESLAEKVEESLRYYSRVWDAKNRTHVHLPVKNEPRFESIEFKHAHITDDLTKLVLYRRLIRLGCTELTEREGELLAKLAGDEYCFQSGESRLWHTTTYFNGGGLSAFTHHGTGYVGFPGGMATVARRLFEYCALNLHQALGEKAILAADWLAAEQSEEGSWPASTGERDGCMASTAEAVRALVAACRQTERPEYKSAADAGIRYISRDAGFFECRQYLRDVDADNFDGLTAEACIHAFLDWQALTGDTAALELARKWACYALQWVRPRSSEYHAEPSFDGLSRSITPRVDVWGSLLIARAFVRLSKATGDEMWQVHACRLFENIANLQERDGGFSETWFLDFPSGLQSVHIEPTFVTDAFIEFILDFQEEKDNTLGTILAARREALRNRFAPLQFAGEPPGFVSVSKDRPEYVIDETLKVGLAFDGAYDLRSRAGRTAYAMMRELAPGRKALKLVPAAKILFNRHRVSAPRTQIGKTVPIEVLGVAQKASGAGRREHQFRAPFHDITLAVTAEGSDPSGCPAADVELSVKTLVGDARVRQVRIDLCGPYEVRSICEKEGVLVSCGGCEYSIEIMNGPLDAIMRDGNKLAFDISMSSNWSFFGEYRLGLRITRRPRESASTRS